MASGISQNGVMEIPAICAGLPPGPAPQQAKSGTERDMTGLDLLNNHAMIQSTNGLPDQ
jgi:hypothetical protein